MIEEKTNKSDILYRYERDTTYISGLDENGEYSYSSIVLKRYSLSLSEYNILSETEKGYWINKVGWGEFGKKWIRKSSKRKFVFKTKEEALINFQKRTEKAVKILEDQLRDSKYYLEEVNKTINK